LLLGVLFYCLTPSENHLQCIRLALSHGAEINAICRSNTASGAISVLQAACFDAVKNEALCLIFLDYDADPNSSGVKEVKDSFWRLNFSYESPDL
jgi:hypothetical protein